METKLKKSVYSALAFNHNLNSNRRENSKHFLKRKIKAAYEREPIEKNKSFFNVALIPNANMFATSASNQGVSSNNPQRSTTPTNNPPKNIPAP